MKDRNKYAASWTPTGRLVSTENVPPKHRLPGFAGPAPWQLRQRMPMTRAEFTEQRLIEAALRGPPPVPSLPVDSVEYMEGPAQNQLASLKRSSGNTSEASSGPVVCRGSPHRHGGLTERRPGGRASGYGTPLSGSIMSAR